MKTGWWSLVWFEVGVREGEALVRRVRAEASLFVGRVLVRSACWLGYKRQ